MPTPEQERYARKLEEISARFVQTSDRWREGRSAIPFEREP